PQLEQEALRLRRKIEAHGRFGIATLIDVLEREHHIKTRIGGRPSVPDFPGQYRYEADQNTMWFQGTTTLATRQFQLTRLLAELDAAEVLRETLDGAVLTNPASRRLAARAMGSYLAGAVIFPYSRFLEAAERVSYDIDQLREQFGASFEQVAHRLVSMRKPGE